MITDPFGLVFVALGGFIFFGLAATRSLLPMSKWKEALGEIDEVKVQKKTNTVYYHVRYDSGHGGMRRAMTLTYQESHRFPHLSPGDRVHIRYATSLLGKKMAIIDEEGFLEGNIEQEPPMLVVFLMAVSLGFAVLGLYLSGLLG